MSTTAPSGNLAPSNTLTVANTATPPPEKTTPTPADRFILFGDNWLTMQTSIAGALQLPINQGDFDTKYGVFPATDKSEISGCLSAMSDLQKLSSTFGDPAAIKKKISTDGDYLTGTTPPTEIYGHIIWLASQIQNVASTFTSTFSILNQVLGSGTQKERADNLRALLTGPGGLASSAQTMHTQTSTLSSILATFDTDVKAGATAIGKYSGSQSKILSDLAKLQAGIAKNITDLTTASEKAHDAWRDYTIAAVTSSVLITILTGGMLAPVGLGLGIGLGVAAAKQMDLYNDLCGQIKTQQADAKKKTQLQVDLQGLNKQVPGLVTATAQFRTELSQIEGVWTDIGGNLNYIATNYTDAQLSDYPVISQISHILDAQTKWTKISETAQQFTQNSLTDFTVGQFGTPISN